MFDAIFSHVSLSRAAPGDISLEELKPTILQGLDGKGVYVLFADDEVWFVRSSVNIDDFKKFFLIESARKFDRQKVLGPHSDIPDEEKRL